MRRGRKMRRGAAPACWPHLDPAKRFSQSAIATLARTMADAAAAAAGLKLQPVRPCCASATSGPETTPSEGPSGEGEKPHDLHHPPQQQPTGQPTQTQPSRTHQARPRVRFILLYFRPSNNLIHHGAKNPKQKKVHSRGSESHRSFGFYSPDIRLCFKQRQRGGCSAEVGKRERRPWPTNARLTPARRPPAHLTP